jgi:transcriptional regulator with XRE-family HTH domain
MATFGERLKKIRKENGLTQLDIAKIAQITDRAVRRFESDENSPNLAILKELSAHFKISLDYLGGISDDPVIHSPATPTSEEAAALERETI